MTHYSLIIIRGLSTVPLIVHQRSKSSILFDFIMVVITIECTSFGDGFINFRYVLIFPQLIIEFRVIDVNICIVCIGVISFIIHMSTIPNNNTNNNEQHHQSSIALPLPSLTPLALPLPPSHAPSSLPHPVPLSSPSPPTAPVASPSSIVTLSSPSIAIPSLVSLPAVSAPVAVVPPVAVPLVASTNGDTLPSLPSTSHSNGSGSVNGYMTTNNGVATNASTINNNDISSLSSLGTVAASLLTSSPPSLSSLPSSSAAAAPSSSSSDSMTVNAAPSAPTVVGQSLLPSLGATSTTSAWSGINLNGPRLQGDDVKDTLVLDVSRLKQKCSEMKLPKSGNKPVLLQRIFEAMPHVPSTDPNGCLLHDAIGIASSISGMGLASIKQILSELKDADEPSIRKLSKEDALDAMVDGNDHSFILSSLYCCTRIISV